MVDAVFLTSDDVDDLAPPGAYVDAARDGYRQRGEDAPARVRTRLAPERRTAHRLHRRAPRHGGDGRLRLRGRVRLRDGVVRRAAVRRGHRRTARRPRRGGDEPGEDGRRGRCRNRRARPPRRVDRGLIGSGRQARAALRATATVRDLGRVRVHSPTPAHRRELAADPPVDVPHEAVDAPAAAVRDADIVITVTTASEPVFDGDDLRPGTHVTAMGQYHPDRRELDATTVARLTV
jgi:alanine dehydrogenase